MPSIGKNTLVRRFLEQGWLPNLVIGVLLLALTQATLRGVIFAITSMLVFLITTAKFKQTNSQQSKALDSIATVIGNAVGVFCLLVSIYWCFRAPIVAAAPPFTVSVMQSQMEFAAQNGVPTHDVSLSPTTEYRAIVGTNKSGKFSVIPAEGLAQYVLSNVFDYLEYTLSALALILLVTFGLTLLIRKFASFVWAHFKVPNVDNNLSPL